MMKHCTCLFLVCSLFLASPGRAQEEKDDSTVIERGAEAQKRADKYPNLVNLYRPNYILPYYQTHIPYQAIYIDETPNHQRVQENELKAQLSFLIPITRHLIKNKPLSLNVAYTQLMYWQVYAKSQYFRETNYEPELFIENIFNLNTAVQLGINHQSNGRGGELERSWNRLYLQGMFSGEQWLVYIRAWTLIAKSESSDLHNPDIAHYLGYENILLSYKIKKFILSAQAQNIESGYKRGFVQLSVSYPLFKKFSASVQFFNGYGQSLIEYNHNSTSFGIGLVLNDWAV